MSALKMANLRPAMLALIHRHQVVAASSAMDRVMPMQPAMYLSPLVHAACSIFQQLLVGLHVT